MPNNVNDDGQSPPARRKCVFRKDLVTQMNPGFQKSGGSRFDRGLLGGDESFSCHHNVSS